MGLKRQLHVWCVWCVWWLVSGGSTLQAQLASPHKEQWWQFRGPSSNPVSDEAGLPTRWSANENVDWVADIAGRGWSSPIVVQGRVLVTSVETEGESKTPQTGTDYSNAYIAELSQQGLTDAEIMEKVNARDFEMPEEVLLHYWLHCLDLQTGQVLWQREFHSGRPPGGRHRKNSFASETPTTDGRRIFVYTTNLTLIAYDLDGVEIWRVPQANYRIYLEFGTGSSPVVVDDKVIVLADNEEHSTLTAYSCDDGKVQWQNDREPPINHPTGMPKSGWTTPLIWTNPLRQEIVTVGPSLAISYDLLGKELWRMSGITPAPSAGSLVYKDRLILNAGKGQPIYAIRPGAHGDITLADNKQPSEFVVWVQPRVGTYIPTPVAYQDGIYIINDNGIVTRLDASSGDVSFKKRLSDSEASGIDFTASAWAYDGQVFCASEQGNIYVLKAGPEFELAHVNRLGDWIMATPALVGDRLLLRTEKKLYAFKQPPA